VHDEAPAASETNWPQILALYEVLSQVAPGPVVTLSRAVALAMVHGPKAGLALLGELDADDRMTHTHRLDAVRAHLLERAATRRGPRVLPAGSEDDGERARTTLPHATRRPAAPTRPPWRPGGLTPADMPARSPQIRLACRPGRLSLSVPGHTVGM